MKKIFFILLLSTLGTLVFGQEITLKSGTEATYRLSKGADEKIVLSLIDTMTINQPIDLSNNLLKDKVDTNQIKIILIKGKMGNDPQTFLMIKTGKPGLIKYSAKIKQAGRSRFVDTDVNMIIGNVKTLEMWPYEISDIILFDFSEGQF